MTASLAVLCLAALAAVAYATSAIATAGLWLARRAIDALAPAAQARLYLAAALLPGLVAGAVMVAALAPSFGWIADHCAVFGDPHGHPHICADHHVASAPAATLTALAVMIALRLLLAGGGRCHALVMGRIARRALDGASRGADGAAFATRPTSSVRQPDIRVLPIDDARAFALGLFRPAVYVTRGLVTGAGRAHLPAVLAHERAHVRRRDPLRRFAAGFALALHLPGAARWIDRRLARAQEMAADEDAAGEIGCRAAVARALVALARAGGARGDVLRAASAAFAGSDVETRVLQLIDERPRRDWPRSSTFAIAAALALLFVGAGAGALHHGVEMLLGALGS